MGRVQLMSNSRTTVKMFRRNTRECSIGQDERKRANRKRLRSRGDAARV